MSQFGRPKFVGARRPVIVSCGALASLIMMFVASSGLILAVKYYPSVVSWHGLYTRREEGNEQCESQSDSPNPAPQ